MGIRTSYQEIISIVLGLGVTLIFTSPAYAEDSAMQESICYVVGIIWGPMGAGMATLGVSAVAAAAALGKASWGMALTVCAGIAIMFGAGPIANTLGIGNGCVDVVIQP